MKKIVIRAILSLSLFLFIFVIYFSSIGVKTNKFNSKIISQINQIEPDIELKLNDVSAKLDLFNFGINLKTIGADIIHKKKIIKIETIKSRISLKSILNKNFFLTEIFISTKPLVIKDLITFVRLFNKDLKLFIAEKIIKKVFIVADLNLEFDETGSIKKNYEIKGLVKDGNINLSKNINLNKIDFIFEINKKALKFNNIKISFNNNNILIPEIVALENNGEYLVSGKLNTNNTSLTKMKLIV